MKQKTITIRHQVPKAKEGKYYSIPFEVPEGVESMRIRYTYPKDQKAIVDLGLMDNQGRFIGWSGSARNEITVGPYDATPGYWMTKAEKGSWQILVGAYHIPADPLPVTYEITYLMPDARWLAGDLHVHSTASDGKLSPYELGMLARKRGLDFLAIADHNNFCENFALPKIPGLTLIPAVEWTHYKGHMNFFGIKAPFDQSFVANDIDEMRTLIRQAKNKGALISVNHPKCPRCPYLWEDDTIFDLVEIWNGPMRKANTDAILWWHQMLLSGRKMPIVGGSDFHRTLSPVRLSNPTTFVYAKSAGTEDILSAILSGRSYVSFSPHGPRLSIEKVDCLFGHTIQAENGRKWIFTAKNMQPGMELQLITDQGVKSSCKAKLSEKTIHLSVQENNWTFAYLKVILPVGKHPLVLAISNPVYLNK